MHTKLFTIPIGQHEKDIVTTVEDLRQEWRNVFDPASTKESASKSYETVRNTFLASSELVSGKVLESKVKDALPTAPSFEEFLGECERGIRFGFFSYAQHPGPRYGGSFGMASFVASLVKRPESYFVVPVMVGGFTYGSEIYKLLEANAKVADFSLIGYSSGNYDTQHGDHLRFRNGKPMSSQLLLPPDDLKRIKRNTNKPALVVDDAIVTGETITVIDSELKELGFSEVYNIEDCNTNTIYFY